MKKLLTFLLSLVFVSCFALHPTAIPTATATPTPDIFNTPWADHSIFKSGLVNVDQSALDKLSKASVYHLEFKIADDLYHVSGTEDVHYTNAEDVSLDKVELRLFPNILGGEMAVSNIQVDGQAVTPQYGLGNSLLIVPFAKALQPGQSILLHMDFAVTVPQTVDRNYGVLAYFDNVLALAHSYPMICVYDAKGWHAEIPPQSGDVTFADASFFLVKVSAPKGLTLVTTGETIRSDEAGQIQTLSVANGPARDFYLVASPNYEKTCQTFGETPLYR